MTLTKTQKEIIRLMREGAYIYRFPYTNDFIVNSREWTRANKINTRTVDSLLNKGLIECGKIDWRYVLTEKGKTITECDLN